jgi:hypothetical protein
MDLYIGTIVSINSPALEVACRKFEIVIFAENARIELKSSAKES